MLRGAAHIAKQFATAVLKVCVGRSFARPGKSFHAAPPHSWAAAAPRKRFGGPSRRRPTAGLAL